MVKVQNLEFLLIGLEIKDNINLYPDKLPEWKCDFRNRSDFLLALREGTFFIGGGGGCPGASGGRVISKFFIN